MAKQTKELSVIDFEKFSIAQLPELQGKKEEIASIIKANPIVEIVDNSTYELAKKSRTAVKTLRTGLEKEQKDVKKKIKEFVLDVVDGEYSNLVTDVKSAEKERQDPIDTWETKKEQERQEKLLLEQQRVEGIKAKIKEFGDVWEQAFSLMKYENIKECIDTFQESVQVIDVKELEQFEILFTDKVDDLRAKLDSRITLLTTEEELRLERERLAEIQAEQNRVNAIKTKIDSWEKNWLYVINNLEFINISVTQNEFETQTALDCQELQSEYAEKRNQIQELLSAKISQLKEAEEQRIERENFLKEKAEFEAKQLEAKFQERKKYLIELGMTDDMKERLVFEDMEFRYSQIKEFSEDNWHEYIEYIGQKISEFNKPKEEVKTDEIAQEQIKSDLYSTSEENISGEQTENYHEEDVDIKGIEVLNTTYEETKEVFEKMVDEKLSEDNEVWLELLQEFNNQLNSKPMTIGKFILKMKTKFELKRI